MRTILYTLWAAIVCILVGIGALLVWPEQPQPGIGEPFGGSFSLVDFNNKPITEAAFRGHPTLVFFGFTHCPEVCPTTIYEMNGWLESLGAEGERIKSYFVTVDPERDTPEVLRDYITSISDRIDGVTGTPEKVSRLLKQSYIYTRRVNADDGDYTMDHSSSVILLDPDGQLVGTIPYGEAAETAIEKLKRLAAM